MPYHSPEMSSGSFERSLGSDKSLRFCNFGTLFERLSKATTNKMYGNIIGVYIDFCFSTTF
jgi:hypothetical protein